MSKLGTSLTILSQTSFTLKLFIMGLLLLSFRTNKLVFIYVHSPVSNINQDNCPVLVFIPLAKDLCVGTLSLLTPK